MAKGTTAAVVVAVLAVGMLGVFELTPRVALPDLVLNHTVHFFPDLLTQKQGDALRTLIKDMGKFPTNIQDVRFYTTKHEHIGEAEPIGDDGKCEHPFLTPDNAKENCVLPGRVDIGKHFVMTGGVNGLKESYDTMLARIQSFGRYMFNPSDYPAVADLFDSEKFQRAAKSVCPAHSQVLDPFQFNFIIQVPGQTVALHLDAPYFWGASRFHYPQWLLACMVLSGKFDDKFIDQVQVVAYLHEWEDAARQGNFVYWTDNTRDPSVVPPTPHAGSVVDGSKTVHAALVYRPDDKPPIMDKSENNALILDRDSAKWVLSVLGEDGELKRQLRNYTFDDLRISIVYRARCFASEEERQRYHDTKDEHIPLDEILETLAQDLVERGKVTSVQQALTMPRYDLASLILKTYIAYPLPPRAMIPYNYCALTRLFPPANFLLQFICG